jgi:hypothetical protein
MILASDYGRHQNHCANILPYAHRRDHEQIRERAGPGDDLLLVGNSELIHPSGSLKIHRPSVASGRTDAHMMFSGS